jgi:hypothetical protein
MLTLEFLENTDMCGASRSAATEHEPDSRPFGVRCYGGQQQNQHENALDLA